MPGHDRTTESETAGVPPDYRPQLALLVDAPPEGDEWLHEAKYDGYRIGARVRGKNVQLISRRAQDWTASFPNVADAVRKLGLDAGLLDGEVAVLEPNGRTSFQALQNAFKNGAATNVVYFAFDLLWHDGEDTARLPTEDRKTRLAELLSRDRSGLLRYASHIVGEGKRVFDTACTTGLEGIVSKRRNVPYKWAKRDTTWQKTKCVLEQEFVIAGFTDPEGSREGIGALLIGYYDRGRLVYSGKVGTGFSRALALDLRSRLDKLEQSDCPFDVRPAVSLGENTHWVRPTLVGEVKFTEWTNEGTLRHPSFQGLRPDKKAKEVRRDDAAKSPTGEKPTRR